MINKGLFKKVQIILISLSVLVLLVACGTDDTEEPVDEETDNEEIVEDEEEENNNESETDSYDGIQKSQNYFIESKAFDREKSFYTAFSINRDKEGENISLEDRLKESLLTSDPSEQDILQSYTDLSFEESELVVQFNIEGNELSTTTAQSTLFFDTLFGISAFYGAEEIRFLNPDGEEEITVAERLIDNPIVIEDERGTTRGYYAIYDEEEEKTFFLPGAVLDEQIVNENDEPLSFTETVKTMITVDTKDTFYSSAIVEGIEIVGSSIENGVATVQYTIDEEKVTEADRTVFENAIQLTALDFEAWEVRLMNDTVEEIITYPLVGQ